MVVATQAVFTQRVEGMHPTLDTARVFAKPVRYFVTAAPDTDQQHGVQPMQEAQLGSARQGAR